MSCEHERRPAESWRLRLARNMVRGLVWSTGNVDAIRASDGHAAPDPQTAKEQLGAGRPSRDALLADWTRSGDLTYGDAELLVALDDTTPWHA